MSGQSAEETLRQSGEEGVAARARKVEAAPSKKEVEDQNLDHAVFRCLCPRCAKGRAEACGSRKRGGKTGDAPTDSLDYLHTHSEQEKEEEKGMPGRCGEGQPEEDGDGEGCAEQGHARLRWRC